MIGDPSARIAWVIVREDGRFFFLFDKSRQAVTAWSLAGAFVFSPDSRLQEVVDGEQVPGEFAKVQRRASRHRWRLKRVEVQP